MTLPDTPTKKKHSNNRQRKLTLRCRALPAEAEQIRKLANDLGMSVSEVLREAALGTKIRRPRKPLPSIDRQVLAQLIGQLGKVGSNLNQLARQANRTQTINENPDEFASTVRNCRRLMDHLTKLLT